MDQKHHKHFATNACSDSCRLKTVLLVEDDSELLYMVRLFLEDSGFVVLEARNGVEAVQISRSYRERIDLLLTDVLMPQMSGPEAASVIKSDRPDIKVLFMSGSPQGLLALQRTLTLGDPLIEKPFAPIALQQKIFELLT